MADTTATELLAREFERTSSRPVPDWVKTEEDLLTWKIQEIWRRAQEEVRPLAIRLAEIEGAKPPKPMLYPKGSNILVSMALKWQR